MAVLSACGDVAGPVLPDTPSTEIAYVGGSGAYIVDIETMALTEVASEGIANVRWSRDGKRLITYGGDGVTVYEEAGPGEWEGRHVSIAIDGHLWDALEAPDGSAFAVWASSHEANEDHGIFRVNADGTNLETLSNSSQDEYHPRWSPSGRQIVFVRQPDIHVMAGYFTWIMSADGSNQRELVFGRRPEWSPTGSHIAFDDNRNVWVMRADGSGRRRLTDASSLPGQCDTQFLQPRWSPTGRRVVFFSTGCYGRIIWTVDVRGGEPVQLTQTEGTDRHSDIDPEWSPDGENIVFARDRYVFVMPATGGEPRKVSHSVYERDCRGTWRPPHSP